MNHRTTDGNEQGSTPLLGERDYPGGQVLVSPVLPLAGHPEFSALGSVCTLALLRPNKSMELQIISIHKRARLLIFFPLGKKLTSEIAVSKGRSIFRMLLYGHTHTHTHTQALSPVTPLKGYPCYSSHPFNTGCLFSQTRPMLLPLTLKDLCNEYLIVFTCNLSISTV